VRRVLLALFPAPWRARYGEEFEVLLEERPLGPFDVADILLAAFDAHLHLRGLTAATDHAKGFVMTLRIGGLAAVFGGLAWAAGLIWSSVDGTDDVGAGIWVFVAGTVLLLLALVGLSAFQSRGHPRLVWAAFIVPAVGAVVTMSGALMMLLTGDAKVFAGLTGWEFWFIGLVTLIFGSGLFALASWRTGSVSRLGSAMLGASALLLVFVLPAVLGLTSFPWEPVIAVAFAGQLLFFAGGWIVLGIGAIRMDRPITLVTTGGA
jgi:hypothetical protein